MGEVLLQSFREKKKSEQKASEIITQALVKVERKVEAKFKLFRLCEDADLTKKKKMKTLIKPGVK